MMNYNKAPLWYNIKIGILCLMIQGGGFLPGFSQNKQDYHWVMGYNSSSQLPHPDLGGTNWLFSEDSLILVKTDRRSNFFVTDASICDENNGDLLFYTDGCSLFDKNGQVILGGDTINKGVIWLGQCPILGYIQPQGALIFESKKLGEFHVLHQKAEYNPVKDVPIGTAKLLLSKLTREEVGSAFLVSTLDSIVLDTMIQSGHLMSIKHENELPRRKHRGIASR